MWRSQSSIAEGRCSPSSSGSTGPTIQSLASTRGIQSWRLQRHPSVSGAFSSSGIGVRLRVRVPVGQGWEELGLGLGLGLGSSLGASNGILRQRSRLGRTGLRGVGVRVRVRVGVGVGVQYWRLKRHPSVLTVAPTLTLNLTPTLSPPGYASSLSNTDTSKLYEEDPGTGGDIDLLPR